MPPILGPEVAQPVDVLPQEGVHLEVLRARLLLAPGNLGAVQEEEHGEEVVAQLLGALGQVELE
eukprot:2908905-Alexandrium_andersonii.AAC.1